MARRIALLAALAALVLPAAAGAATPARFFAGTPVDGPSAGHPALGDLDVARDGTGALAYVKRDAGDRPRLRLAAGRRRLPAARARRRRPGRRRLAARRRGLDGGRLVVAFVSGGRLFTAVRPAGAPGSPRPSRSPTPASNPDVDMSINGVGLRDLVDGAATSWPRAWSATRRRSTACRGPLDIDPAAIAGTGTGRPKVAVAADGVATVVWGEGGHAYARRIFELRLSTAPQDLGDGADEPDISSEDDSSFAWAVFRQGGQAIARRLVGSQFDPPVPIEAAEGSDAPRVAINGRGVGYAGVGGARDARRLRRRPQGRRVQPGRDDRRRLRRGAGARAGGGRERRRPRRLPAGRRRRRAHRPRAPYDYVPASRVVTPPGPGRDALRPRAGADRRRARARGGGRSGRRHGRGLRPGRRRRAPDRRRQLRPRPGRLPAPARRPSGASSRARPLKWGTAFELWGPLTYRVEIDGQPVGTTTSTGITVPTGARRTASLARGRHRHPRPERGDAVAQPARRRHPAQGHLQGLGVAQARPAGEGRGAGHRRAATGAKASGLNLVHIKFGDGSATVTGLKAAHRYGHSGKVTVRVSASDKAGNAIAVTRRITIRK